ncbi:hypothetical protein HYU19_01140 [Candidatus Woesearchaeota archaeon]|nr:hypothetical protein [Candidatus Woesearchaeota archaeon]
MALRKKQKDFCNFFTFFSEKIKKWKEVKQMEYILMRHANDDGLNDTYCKIRDLASRNGVTLDRASILERMTSLAVDPSNAYVHPEVIEIARQREERRQELLRQHPDIQFENRNVLAETAGRINQRVSGRPLTIAYNNALRTEFTALAIARITGGNLIAGELEEAGQVYQWMRNHAGEDGLSLVVTHEPAIRRITGIWGQIPHSSAYFVGRLENGRITDFQEV